MEYYWPKLSKKGVDFGFIRLGHAHGLGNLLIAWAKCIVYAHTKGLPENIIAPTWPQFSPHQWLHGDKDKRLYTGLFDNDIYINSLKKVKLLATLPKIAPESTCGFKDCIKVFTIDTKSSFQDILKHHTLVFNELKGIAKPRNKDGLFFDFSNSISLHVRFGDFLRVDRATDLSFFLQIIDQLRCKTNKDIVVYVFSDATDSQLSPLLKLKNVRRVFFGNSLADILAMSNSKVLVASRGSSFSKWASFLGRMPVIFPERNWIELYYENPQAELVLQKNEEIPKGFLKEVEKSLSA